MLHNFSLAERDAILALCEEKILRASEARSSSDEMESGLPIFYDELIEVLRLDEEGSEESDDGTRSAHRGSAMRRGKESLRLGYTISQVVHGYGALCQAITEYATSHGNKNISSREFNRLNFCLDVAIAEAVTEFSKRQLFSTTQDEIQRLGFFAHEMRNALASAAAAHRMIQKGMVGIGGSTARILENSLRRMKDLIDQSLSEVRLRGEPVVERERCRVIDLVGEVEATAALDAGEKSIKLHVEVAPDLMIDADHHLVVSAISNLVQNAIKFTKVNGRVSIRARSFEDRVLIEVEDECGGLPAGKIEELFHPFTQRGADKKGLGLGLSIVRRAIELNSGHVSAVDIPAKGCRFTINLPLAEILASEKEATSAANN